MKKILVFIALAAFCGGLSLQASPVSPEKALDIAKKIFDAQKTTKSGSSAIKIIWNGEFEDDPVATKAAVQPAFYVVARDGGGWVMVAGDDNVRPVLGISTDGHFETDGMPDNVRWWMEQVKQSVRSVKTPTSETKELWNKYIDTKAGNASIEGEPSNTVDRWTPEWDQGNNDMFLFGRPVFNSRCPKIGNDFTLTGCVATALGEVLTYQSGQTGVSVPTTGTGSVGGYNPRYSGDVAPAEYDLGTVYLWSELRTLTDWSAIQDAINDGKEYLLDNLAQLLADLGAAMHASYNTDGTSASASTYYMAEHFGFNKAAYYDEADNYPLNKWIGKLKDEIDRRPIIFSADSRYGGHAFVLDGYGSYQGNTVFHVNFGWSGSNNGYYYVNNLDAGGTHQYIYHCDAIFDFFHSPQSVYPAKLETIYGGNEYWPGIYVERYNETTNYNLSYIVYNKSDVNYVGQIKFLVQKKDGTQSAVLVREDGTQEYIPLVIDISLAPWTYSGNYMGFVTINDYSFGDRVVCYFKDGDNWKLLGCQAGTAVSEWPLMPSAFILTESSYSVGDAFFFRLINYNRLYIGTKWTIIDPDGQSNTYDQLDDWFELTKPGKYKIEAAIAEDIDEEVTETVVAYITVGN